MDRSQDEIPDMRFWTQYDYFQLEREARAWRRKQLRLMSQALWKKLKARLAHAPAAADAQPALK